MASRSALLGARTSHGILLAVSFVAGMFATSRTYATEAPYEFPIARFGSRVVLDPCPVQGGIRLSATGGVSEEPVPARFGFSITRQVWTLPFERNGVRMRRLEQRVTPTSLALEGSTEAETLRYTWRVVAPFVPGDARISTAPVFLLEILVENTGRRRRPCLVHVKLPLPGEGVEMIDLGSASALRSAPGPNEEWILAWAEDHDFVFARNDDTLRFGCELGPRQQRTLRFALATYRDDVVAEFEDRALRFRYTQSFDGARDVATWALREWSDLIAASRAFDATITDTGLPSAIAELAASAFTTFASNTAWLVDTDGNEWLVVEDPATGRAISYREMLFVAPFLGAYWPSAFATWFRTVHDAASDAGEEDRLRFAEPYRTGSNSAFAIRPPATFEECASWLLLLDRALAVDPSLDFERFASWFDVAIAALEGSDSEPDFDRDEVFSSAPAYDGAAGWLSLSALEVSARRMRMRGDAIRAGRLEDLADLRRSELESRFWRGDHYAMFAGHDGGSPGVLAACLPAIFADEPAAMPDPERRRADLEWLRSELGKAGGLGESLADRRTSIALACARGLVTAYAGDRVDLAWFDRARDAFVKHAIDRESFDRGGYRDRPGATSDSPSNRGMILFEVPRALAGLRIDDHGGVGYRTRVDPAKLRVALVERARWDEGRIPWLEMERSASGSFASLRHRALLGPAAEVYERSDDTADSIVLDVLTNRPPVVRGSAMRVLGRACDAGAWRIDLRDRADEAGAVTLRVPSLPPGEYSVASYEGELALVDAARLREGIELDRSALSGAGVVSDRLGGTRVRYLELAYRVAEFLGDDDMNDWARGSLRELASAIDRRLEADRRARALRIELRRLGASGHGSTVAPQGAGDSESAERSDDRRSVPEQVAALLTRALDEGDDDFAMRLTRALRPFEWSFTPSADDVEALGTLRWTNVWLPSVSGTIEVTQRGASDVAATAFENLETGETHVAAIRIARTSDTTDEVDIVPLHDAIEARARIEWDDRVLVLDRTFGLTSGTLDWWLLSRVYTLTGQPADGTSAAGFFDRVEPPETEAEPRINSGDANWRARVTKAGRLDLGTTMRVADRYAAYAYSAVFCESGGDVVFAGEASGRVRLLVNGVAVFAPDASAFAGGRFQARATLRPGWNEVLVKVENGPGGWGLRLSARGVDPALDAELRVLSY